MINAGILRRGWLILQPEERTSALVLLVIVSLSALAAAAMVASVMPFLYVLAQPEVIHTSPVLAWLYETFGFTSDYGFLIALGLGSLTVVVAAGALQVARALTVAHFCAMRAHTISRRLLAAYLGQPYEFFLTRHSGAISTQILAETQQIVSQFFRPAVDTIAGCLTIFAVVGLLIAVDPVTAISTFSVFGFLYGAVFLLSRRILLQAGQRRLDANRERYRITGEALGGVKYVKLSGQEASYVARYDEPSRAFARAQMMVGVIGEVPLYAMQAIAFGGSIVFCLALLDPGALASGATLGGILPTAGLFAAAAMRLMPELAHIYRAIAQLQASGPALNAIYNDLVTAPAPAPATAPPPLPLTQTLRLEKVTYRYSGSERRAGIEDISLTIRAGEKVGFVGATGAGKTTIADVILGLLTPESGRMTVDGVVVNAGTVRSWQRSLGYVPQDIFLVDASVAENVALGVRAPDIDMDRVRQAAAAARIDGFVTGSLPDGYETVIGERGVRLSGGQRQRLAIARALYSDADLILFDEATSALDTVTEREVMAAIDGLPGEKTLLMIAHRLSTLKVCDRIVLMRAGRIAAVGTWDELLAQSSEFRAMATLVEAA